MNTLEILEQKKAGPVRAAIFDFDGTLSTLRFGWEHIMLDVLMSVLGQGGLNTPDRRLQLEQFIRETTGIQTAFQMQQFTGLLTGWGYANVRDPWYYKDLYNEALMEMVRTRTSALINQKTVPEDYRMAGSVEFLRELADRNIQMFIASGTDHEDVVREVEALGFSPFFRDIKGAPHRKLSCPKEAAFAQAVEDFGFTPEEILVVGDGKVEIRLAVEKGAWPLGLASDEARRRGVDPIKKERLIRAKAWAISGDFLCKNEILEWLGL